MESNNKNKFIVVSYALYDVTKGDNGEEMLIERTTDERPVTGVQKKYRKLVTSGANGAYLE